MSAKRDLAFDRVGLLHPDKSGKDVSLQRTMWRGGEKQDAHPLSVIVCSAQRGRGKQSLPAIIEDACRVEEVRAGATVSPVNKTDGRQLDLARCVARIIA